MIPIHTPATEPILSGDGVRPLLETPGKSPSTLPYHHTYRSPFDMCAVVAVRDLFSFYGLHQEALTLETPMRKMLSNILEHGLQGVDVARMNQAFKSFPPQSEGGYRIENAIKQAYCTQNLKGFVDQDKKVLSTPSILLFLAECGLEPKTVKLGNPKGIQEAWHTLNQGQPLLVCEDQVIPLYFRIQGKQIKPTGHMFMLLKQPHNQQVYLYDINAKEPLPVPMDQLRETFEHPNTRAIIVQNASPIIPARLQGQPTRALPL